MIIYTEIDDYGIMIHSELFMQRNLLKIFIIALIGICIVFYLINSNSPKHNSSIDLTGNDSFWRASLNIQVGYRSELIIRPVFL